MGVARQQTSSHHTSPRLATPDHHELAELCRRSAHQHQSHQERSDRRPRRQHLGVVSRLPVTAVELKTLLGKYASTDELAMNGVTVGGVKYMFLSANDRVVRAKKGTSGVHCIKTVQALIVCVYEEPVVPEQAATVTEKLGEYLISVGY